MNDKNCIINDNKKFTLSKIEDGCIVVGSLIAQLSNCIELYEKYYMTAKEKLDSSGDNDYIGADEFLDIQDKILYRQNECIKFCADNQKDSFSYFSVQKKLRSKKFINNALDQEVIKDLEQFKKIRGEVFHNPNTLLNASKVAYEKRIPENLKDVIKIQPQLNPVLIPKAIKYNICFLIKLCISCEFFITKFKKILESMKADYQAMFDSIYKYDTVSSDGTRYGREVKYKEFNITKDPTDLTQETLQLSSLMQRNKL